MAAERLVDRVVDNLPQAVHQPPGVGRADVHRGPFSNCLKTLQDQQVPCLVLTAFRCWAGSWHAPRVPREQASEPVSRGQSELCVVLESLMAAQRPKADRFTGFVTQQSLPRDEETEQSEADEMLKRCQACIHRDARLRTARSSDRQEGRPDREHSCHRRFPLERLRSLRSVWRASLRTSHHGQRLRPSLLLASQQGAR